MQPAPQSLTPFEVGRQFLRANALCPGGRRRTWSAGGPDGARALVNTTQQVGNSLGVALLNTIAATATATYLASHRASTVTHAAGLVHGYTTAFIIGAASLGASALVSVILVRARRQHLAAGGGEDTLTEMAEVI